MTIENPYPLAAELARPVARGWLDYGDGILVLADAALQRAGVTGYTAKDTFRGLKHIYGQHLARERMALAIERHRQWLETRHGR